MTIPADACDTVGILPTEAELLAARITRIKLMLATLERECGATLDANRTFLKLKAELDVARESLRILDTHKLR